MQKKLWARAIARTHCSLCSQNIDSNCCNFLGGNRCLVLPPLWPLSFVQSYTMKRDLPNGTIIMFFSLFKTKHYNLRHHVHTCTTGCDTGSTITRKSLTTKLITLCCITHTLLPRYCRPSIRCPMHQKCRPQRGKDGVSNTSKLHTLLQDNREGMTEWKWKNPVFWIFLLKSLPYIYELCMKGNRSHLIVCLCPKITFM